MKDLRFNRLSRVAIAVASSLLALALSHATLAQAAQKVRLDIPAQDLSAALTQFGRETGTEIVFAPDAVREKKAIAVQGEFDREQALALILKGSGLTYRVTSQGAVVVESAKTSANASEIGAMRLAQAENSQNQDSPQQTSEAEKSKEAKSETSSEVSESSISEVIVTGTRIRNVHDQFAPVTRLGRDEMELAGNTTVFDAIDHLPQNFGGGVSPETSVALSASGAGAASVNLRGLGNEATLVLVNSRRLAPGGALGGFVDISSLPVSAIDRIEILPDGASAIYGSDAVAGVVNVIMRDDFSGAETRVGYSAATEGGAPAFTLGQTFGWAGDRAHGLVTLEYVNEEALLARDKEFSRGIFPDSQLLTPSSEKHSVFASGGVRLTDNITLSGDAYYNHRQSTSKQAAYFGVFLPTVQHIDVEQYGATAGLNWLLPGEWEADFSAVLSRSNFHSAGSQDTSAFGGGIVETVDSPRSEVASVDATIGGPILRVTDEPVRVVFGIHGRSESIELNTYYPPSPSPFDVIENRSREVHAIFGEIYAPIVTENDGVPGINRLALTTALRYEDYDDFGSTTNPRYGVVWSPLGGLTFRGTYGTSFRAPSLERARNSFSAMGGVYVDPDSPTGTSVALALGGQRKELGPETADVWTAGFDFRPEALSPFAIRMTYFNIDYADRIDFPRFVVNSSRQFTNFTGEVVRDPSLQDVLDYLANANSFFDYANAGGAFPPFDPNNVDVILDSRLQNLASSFVEGVDFDISYGISNNDSADWTFSLGGTLLTAYEQQAAPTVALSDLLNTFGNPVDLRIRGGVQRVSETTTASLFVNYVDHYRDTASTTPSFVIDEWITVDASLRLDLGEILGGVAQETSLTLTAQNLLDEPPPRIGNHPANLALYDPTNSDAAGRRLGIVLTKRW